MLLYDSNWKMLPSIGHWWKVTLVFLGSLDQNDPKFMIKNINFLYVLLNFLMYIFNEETKTMKKLI